MSEKTKYIVRQFYGTFSEKIVEAGSEEEAEELAEHFGWDTDQVLDKCEWTGGETVNAADDNELTEISEQEKIDAQRIYNLNNIPVPEIFTTDAGGAECVSK